MDTLFALDTSPKWTDLWKGMPEFIQDDLGPEYTINVHFRNQEDFQSFAKLIEQDPAAIRMAQNSTWFPAESVGTYKDKRWQSTRRLLPQYPIYVISKGRSESRLTARHLEKIGVPYRIVIEPQERDDYACVIDPKRILVLPFSDLGQGSIPARNWVWEHAITEGHERHWILDDNIAGFFRLNKNMKIPVSDGAIFKAAEEFVDRYENVGISGFQYFKFASRKAVLPPFVLNTRIYSCILIQNDIPYRWRGRYNEDTDLSIRALKDGWCTVLFNAFLCDKTTTMRMGGGNTDELYVDDGRLQMAESLVAQHPDIVKLTEKWGRPQHHVDYSVFAKNKLRLKPGVAIPDGVNNYGMTLKKVGL